MVKKISVMWFACNLLHELGQTCFFLPAIFSFPLKFPQNLEIGKTCTADREEIAGWLVPRQIPREIQPPCLLFSEQEGEVDVQLL